MNKAQFRDENTAGFTEDQLRAMNELFEIAMAEYDETENGNNYEQIKKYVAEKIFNKFSTQAED